MTRGLSVLGVCHNWRSVLGSLVKTVSLARAPSLPVLHASRQSDPMNVHIYNKVTMDLLIQRIDNKR